MAFMKALWLEDGRLRFREDVPRPAPGLGEALVRVRLAGICGTDLEMVKGYYPFTGVLGHEFVGEVVAAPDAPDWVGRRVVGEINVVCHACDMCQRGLERHCRNRTVLGILGRHGAFAEYLTLPLENLHPVPDEVPDTVAVFTEPLAAALEILDQVHLQPTSRVLVVGVGRLGQLIVRVLALTGAHVDVVARRERQRALLRRWHVDFRTAEEVPEGAYDVVVEATGNPEGFALARRALRPRGMLVLKSTYAGHLQVDFSRVVVDEQTLVGSRCGPFDAALRLWSRGLIDPRDLIEATYPLAQGEESFAHAAQPGVFKVLLAP